MTTSSHPSTSTGAGPGTAFDESQAAFASAWSDLGNRMDRGLDTLDAMLTTARAEDGGGDRADALAAKRDGLDQARGFHTDLAALAERDPAGAWRTFTDRVVAAYRSATGTIRTGTTPAFGLGIAAEYQRGYGAEIDAPPLHLLLATGAVESHRRTAAHL